MLRLQKCILTQLPPSTSASTISPLHRLLSAAAAPAVSPSPSFAVEDYLVSTCGLTRAQAVKASAKLSHLKSPSKPDAILGLSSTDVAALVAKDPQFLCAKVEKTLPPTVAGLTGLGLSRSEVARLVSLGPDRFRCRSIVSTLQYCLPLFGSSQNLLRAARCNASLLSLNPERTAKPNVTLLQECGLGACDIAKLCGFVPRCSSPTWSVSGKWWHWPKVSVCPVALECSGTLCRLVAFLNEKKIAATVDHLKKTLRWSDAEVSIALPKAPFVLRKPKESLQCRSKFLISEVGLEPAYIAHRPIMLCYSIEGRLRPRYYVVKFLKGNGLLTRDPSYYTIFKLAEKLFVQKYICPHKEAAPHLAEDYTTACRGEFPARFIFA